MQEVLLKLTVDEVNAILTVLGNQPSHTGVYPLMVKIKQLADEQLQPKKE